MKITVEAESKEIADLVLAVQGQHISDAEKGYSLKELAEQLSRYQKVTSKASD